MSTTKPKPATAVATRPAPAPPEAEQTLSELIEQARTPQEKERLFAVADAIKQGKMARSVASVVAATEWGMALSPTRQIAFAKYCLALGADPLRHVDLLGGNPFINGDYYRDVIAASPDFRYSSDPVWIHDDPRLKLCVVCGKDFGDKPDHGHGLQAATETNAENLSERIRRAGLRVQHNADELSPSICLLVLHYRNCPCDDCHSRGESFSDGSGRGPFRGIGEVHSGRHTKRGQGGGSYEVDRDPIGIASPRATSETRAWREAGEKSEATWFRTHASTLEQLEGKLKQAYEHERIADAAGGGQQERLQPGPVAAEDVTVEPVENGGGQVEPPPSTAAERHEPNAFCQIEGPHAKEDCGIHNKELRK